MVRYEAAFDRRVDEDFHVNEEATLLVLTGEHTSHCVVRYRSEGSLDVGAIDAAVIKSPAVRRSPE